MIIDTPPLGSVIDSAVIADECDGSIIVLESGVISYRFAQDVKGQLEKCNCPILGVILNKVDMSRGIMVSIMVSIMASTVTRKPKRNKEQ